MSASGDGPAGARQSLPSALGQSAMTGGRLAEERTAGGRQRQRAGEDERQTSGHALIL